MAMEEISQLIEDCNVKREFLTNFRDKIHGMQRQLLQFAAKSLPKEDLTDLERFNNRFHIQLINIHDVRDELKVHQQHLKSESKISDSLSAEALGQHKELTDQFHTLESLLHDLDQDFNEFMAKPVEIIS